MELIIDYLNDRSQYTEINTNKSELTKCPNHGVYQGSIFSGLMYLIYTLDINSISHNKPHINNVSEFKCSKPKTTNFVDDIFGIIISDEKDLWKDIKQPPSTQKT